MVLKTIFNHTEISDNLAIGGQPRMDDFQNMSNEGYDVVIHLIVQETITEASQWEKEALWVESAGMKYENIKVQISQPSEDVIFELCNLMKKYNQNKIYLHCAAGFSSAILLTGYRIICKDMSLEEATNDLHHIWQNNQGWVDLFKRLKKDGDIKQNETVV